MYRPVCEFMKSEIRGGPHGKSVLRVDLSRPHRSGRYQKVKGLEIVRFFWSLFKVPVFFAPNSEEK